MANAFKAQARLGRLALTTALLTVLTAAIAIPAATASDRMTTTTSPCALGDQLVDAKQLDAARTEYVRAYLASPGLQCALDGIRRLTPGPPDPKLDPCLYAELLHDEGADKEARDALLKQLEKEATSGPSACTLSLGDLEGRDQKTLNGIVDSLPFIVLGLLALAAVLWVLRRVNAVARLLRRVLPRQLVLGAIGDPADGPACGDSVLALTRQTFVRVSEAEPTEGSFAIVEAFQDLASLSALEKVNAAVAPANAALQLLVAAAGPARWSVAAQLHPKRSDRVSATISFTSSARLINSMTYELPCSSASPTADTSDYMRLATPLAGWTQACVTSQLYAHRKWSASPAAYGWLRAGVAAQEEGDLTTAAFAYRAGLDEDPTYRRAQIGLALVRAEAESDPWKTLEDLLEAVGATT